MSTVFPRGPAPDVTVSIVSYNTRELLRACLRTLRASEGVELDIVVVDNGSLDGSPEMVSQDFPEVTLIRNPENRGFAAANNLAIAGALGRHVLLLNPDTEVTPDAVRSLCEYLDAHPKAGICGPLILNSDRTVQSCGYLYPTLMGEIRQSKNVNKLLRKIIGPERVHRQPVEPTAVEWVDGACFMIRREVIDQIGLLDEQYFLYAEELDWCYNARRAGWGIVANPNAEIVHHQGKSSEQVREGALALLVETRLRYYRKNRGLLIATAVSLIYVIGCLKLYRREPAKCRAKLHGVSMWWRGLGSAAQQGHLRHSATA